MPTSNRFCSEARPRSGSAQRPSRARRSLAAVPWAAALTLASGCVVSFSAPSGGSNNHAPPGCGNGILEPGEVCDGFDFGGQTCQTALDSEFGELACSATCQLDLSACHDCGNGVLDPGETCDDASPLPGDGCGVRCLVESGWQCAGEPSVCGTVCGDGLVRGPEGCDDGGTSGGDGCDGACGIEPGWVCTGEPSQCAQTCGDGALDPGEACDDGNQAVGDGCSPSCAEEAGWTCDGAEPSVCAPICGDGIPLLGEACDDGNLAAGDGCGPSCAVETGWTCDDSGPSACAPICGDGLLRGSEACDDGNGAPSDGCNACQVEPYFACDGEPSQCACVVYVSQAPVPGGRDGSRWGSAYDNLHLALQQAGNRRPCQVWIAAGTYSPWQGNPSIGYNLPDRVQVYGGFAGTETRRDQRDWVANPVILDGRNPAFPSQAVRQVVEISGGQSMVLDGLTLTAANNTTNRGGAVALDSGELVIQRCELTGNLSQEGGAAVWVRSGTLALLDSAVENNVSLQDGGGLYLEVGATATVERTIFQGNQATNLGGAIYGSDATVRLQRCRFLANTADRGGGVRVQQGVFSAESSLFVGNQAALGGGGAVSLSQNTLGAYEIRSCTFYGNTAAPGSGYALRIALGEVSVWNSILWGALDQEVYTMGGTASFTRCDVHRSVGQGDNLNDDPLFVDAPGGDLRLGPTSPCVDAGEGSVAPLEDLGGAAPWDDPAVTDTGTGSPTYADIGCFERQP